MERTTESSKGTQRICRVVKWLIDGVDRLDGRALSFGLPYGARGRAQRPSDHLVVPQAIGLEEAPFALDAQVAVDGEHDARPADERERQLGDDLQDKPPRRRDPP